MAISELNSSSTSVDESGRGQGVRLRAFLVGLPLLVGICGVSVYADMVSKVVQFGVLQLAPPAVAVLFVLALLNRGFVRMLKREWLSRADILVIYAMLLVGVMVSTRGVMEKLIPPLAYLPYFATRENRLNETISQYLPSWALPFTPSAAVSQEVPSAIQDYWIGNSGGFWDVPWNVWVGPLVAWFALIGSVIWVFLCMATILRRQWMDNEQLRFPLTTLPLAIIRDDVEGAPFFSNRVMWAGFAVAAFVFGLNGLRANFSDFPEVVTNLNFGSYFSERPWNTIGYTPLFISLAALGFAFFLPLDLLFSLWFFVMLTRLQDVGTTQFGGIPLDTGTHNSRIFAGYQAAGAYLVLVAAQLRIGWPYFKSVWRTAFGRDKPLDDSGEMMPYRTAILGIVFGFGAIVLWLSLAGMSPWLAAAQMGIYLFIVAFIMSRAVGEAGLLMTETSFLPSHLIGLFVPLAGIGPANHAMLGLTNILFARDLRGVLLSPFMDNQKMAKELGLRQRSLLGPLALAVVVSFVCAAAFFLYFNYSQGGLSLYSFVNKNNPESMFNLSAAGGGTAAKPDATSYAGFVIGIVATGLMVWARGLFAWFPFHPLGYALAPTWTMTVFWFPVFVAWLIKSLVMRFGGIDTFRKVAPFMLGLILGEFITGVMWAIMNMWRGWAVPAMPWP